MEVNNMDEDIKRTVSNILEDLVDGRDVRRGIEYLIRQIEGNQLDEVAIGNLYDTYDGLLRQISDTRQLFFENFANRVTYNNKALTTYANQVEYDWYTRLGEDINEYDLSRPDLRQVVKRQIQILTSTPIVQDIPIQTFTEEEVRFFTNTLDSISSEAPSGGKKVDYIFDFVSEVTTSTATSIKTRKKTYDFWEEVDNQFEVLIEQINNTIELKEKLQLKDEDDDDKLKYNITIPSYIVKTKQLVLRKGILPNHPIVVDILEAKYLGEKIDDTLDREDVAEYDGDKLRGWTQGIGEQDKEYITSIEEAREDLDELTEGSFILKDTVTLDPLLSIILQNEEFPVILNEEQIEQNVQKVIDKQRKDIPEENMEFNIDNLEEIEEHMKKNLKLYEPILQDSYKFAIMDGPEISIQQVKFKDLETPLFEIKVAEFVEDEFIIKEEVFSDYSELVNYINEKTNEFFSFLSDEIYHPESWTKTFSDEQAYRVPHPKAVKTGSGKTGRVTGEGYAIPPYKKVDAVDVPANLSNLTNVIELFYYKSLTKKRVMFNDQPNFVKNEKYMAVERKLSDDFVTRVAREIASGRSKPQFDKEIFININSFIKQLNRANFDRYKKSLLVEAQDFIVAVSTLFKPLGRKDRKQIERNLSAKIGAILYSLWVDTNTNSDAIPPKFMYRRLNYWANLAEKIREQGNEGQLSFVNLARYFERPEIKEYLQSDSVMGEPTIIGRRGEEVVEVRTASDKKGIEYLIYGDNGIQANLIRAESHITPLQKAILDSVDLIRKMNSLPVYYGQLNINSYSDNVYTISHIRALYDVDIYATDIDTIVKSENTINELKNKLGLPKHVVYHVKGLYR
tara:strand:- start:2182 stop:4731 length:2550 start_codon:yes stop_codon:yes gene_type:complete